MRYVHGVSDGVQRMETRVALTVVVCVTVSTLLTAEAATILLVPMNCNSHVMYFSRLGVELSKLGHAITVLAPSTVRVPDFVADLVDRCV